MTEQLISLEIAKLAKEKGFNWPTWSLYDEEGLFTGICQSEVNTHGSENELAYSAPTQSLLQKWLRDVHGVYVSPMFIGPDTNKFQCRFDILGSEMTGEYSEWFDSWEDCLEAGLQTGLSLIPSPNQK